MWACTGICHHARDCENYATQCKSCFYLNSKSSNDLSTQVFNRKKKIFDTPALSIVTCSNWLQSKVQKSELLKHRFNLPIPNPINTQMYAPRDKSKCRITFNLPQDKFLLFFGAANSTDERKGLSYFLESLEILQRQHPDIFKRVEIVVFGEMKQAVKQRIAAPVHVLGYISDEEGMVQLYNAADVFVISSLDENLPNTIMEAMSCGTPCLGFNTGGIPEMIDHQKNGYVAGYKDVQDLANGIYWILNEADFSELSSSARKKAENYYSEEIVAKQYINLYQQIHG
jgi:glycosyltransferase involved in cell wall biosynthesis